MQQPRPSFWFGALGLAMIAGCGTEFTTTQPSSTGTGGGATTTAATSGTGGGATTGTGGGATTSGTGGGVTTSGTGGGATTGTGGGATTGTGGSMGMCQIAADCDAKYGPALCGARVCNAGVCGLATPGCNDADLDGYGAGAGCVCAAIDCDDNDPAVHGTKSCYSGPAGTQVKGACREGTITCTPQGPTACTGEVVPTGEACNGEDDDCNGTIDDGFGKLTCGVGACANAVGACKNGVVQACVPLPPAANLDGCDGLDNNCNGAVDENCAQCIFVAKGGIDATADGSLGMPFGTIQPAIAYASLHTQPRVCVTAGSGCGNGNVGNYGGSFTMANGVSVFGNYDSTNGQRCAANAGTVTAIQLTTDSGVIFPASVNKPTVLDGFRIDRFAGSSPRGVTIDGAKGAVVSNVSILVSANGVIPTNSYGVYISNGADATIGPKDRIEAGTGTTEAIGVRVESSKVMIQDNCQTYDNKGRCNDFCGVNPSIKGGFNPFTVDSYGVLLVGAAGSTVETSAICGNAGVHGATVKVTGDADNVVIRANRINAFSGSNDSHGVWLDDCEDAKPWIVDNTSIIAAGTKLTTAVDGVRSEGKCHAVVDSNSSITGGGEGQSFKPNGVHCAAKNGHPSLCLISQNAQIWGSSGGFPAEATGVRCDGGSCVRIVRNVSIDGRGGTISTGLFLQATGVFVDSNIIGGGCSPTATGVEAGDSFARIQNNVIFGYSATSCPAGSLVQPIESRGLHVVTAAGPNEIDVHSNDIDGAGAAQVACTSYGIKIETAMQPPPSGSGIYRNNIVNAGICLNLRYGVAEASAGADPRIFENNDLAPAVGPLGATAVYLDEGNIGLQMGAQVNALTVTMASNNLAVDPGFVQYPQNIHLAANSPCIGAGTMTGAPLLDLAGKARPSPPSIGCYDP